MLPAVKVSIEVALDATEVNDKLSLFEDGGEADPVDSDLSSKL